MFVGGDAGSPTGGGGGGGIFSVSSSTPEVIIQATTAQTVEGDSQNPGVFTVTRSGDTGSSLTVLYTLGGTATAATDYTVSPSPSGALTIAAGSATATITITALSDGFAEPTETVVATLSGGIGYTVGMPSSATVSIIDATQPVVSIQATTPDTAEGSSTNGVFTLTRTGSTAQPLTVTYTVGGTATSGSDYTITPLSPVIFATGSATATLTVLPQDDSLFEGPETVVVTVAPGPGYTVGTPASAVVSIADNDGPSPIPLSGPVGLIGMAPGLGDSDGCGCGDEGQVRPFDGVVNVKSVDLSSGGFGTDWGQQRGWTNGSGYAAATLGGSGTVLSQAPYLRQDSAGTVAVALGGSDALLFDSVGGNYQARFFLQEQLSYNSGTGEFTLTDTTGNRLRFYDFSTSLPAAQRGRLKSLTDPDGNVTQVTAWTTDGKPQEVQRSNTQGGTTVTESYLYTYLSSGPNAGRMSNATLRRQVNGGAWTTVRQVDYTYYDGVEANGNAGDLKTAVVKDGAGATLDTNYYRYYTAGQANGYQGALKYAFGAQSYARLAAAFPDPFAATDAQVAAYADLYLEYDAVQRVKKTVVQGEGCSICTGGLGTTTYTYTTSEFADGYNNWRRKLVATLPDGNQNIVYSNYAGQVLLEAFKEVSSGRQWITFSKYDSGGRLILKANPSAVSGYDEARPDLLNNQAGNYLYLRDSDGLIETMTYHATTTATESQAGGVAGYQNETKVQRGETGTAVLESTTQYFAHTGGGATVYPVATQTVYRNTDGTGGQTTSYAYTWFASSTRAESVTVTLPVVTAAQNGPGTADIETTFNDVYGRPIWHKDADGFLSYMAYDQATGAVVKTIADVDTTRTGDFTGLPSGWTTPSGGGLHLITQREVDGLGRPTKLTDPNGNLTYAVYKDSNYEVRVYHGWDSTTNLPTGPTEVSREDRPGSYTETLTMSATPTLDGNGRPTGAEAIGSLQTLSRTYVSAGGQVTQSDAYFNLSGLTYSTSTSLGTENVNFYRTRYGYDNPRGWQTRVQLPTGTIERTVYDARGRVASTWVGTNDTPTSGLWSPTNNGPPCNMVQVSANVYDDGGVGESLLTKVTLMPGGGAADRVAQYFFDWRDRLVATKEGVQGSEGTDVQRPIFYTEYDNLDQAIASEQYDGDNVSLVDADNDGAPDKPSASLLRARSTTSFDEQGRVYRTQTYSVDQSTGGISSTALTTDTWYDHRGQVIKTAQPGGLVQKTKYDGAGRVVKLYTTDGGGDSTWADAGNVISDAVLEQTEYGYDAAGNVILGTMRQRFHDETATGELGDPTNGPKARVSYQASYFDRANRLTDLVDVGTNGGTAYTRPGTVPARSDTVLVSSQAYNAAGWVETTTDPRGILTKVFYDNLGRATKMVEAYTDGVPTANTNKTTEQTYDGSGHMLTLKATLPAGAYETTQFVYGVTTAGGSGLNSNDVLAATKYPDKTTGDPSASEQESYTVNALGERKTLTDRNGSVHTYSYDVVGRMTADAVTTLGASVDGAVRRLETAYDTAGRPYLYTSYDAATAGNIVNQVQQSYNGLGQLVTEYQSHAGAVNTLTTPKVQYAYSEMAGGANHSRLVSMTYPNGRVLSFNYAAGLDNNISRLTSITDGSTTLESYAYLGLGTVVKRSHPQPGVDLTYVKLTGESNGDAGDQYTGLDRFSRVVDQRWVTVSTGTATDRFAYGYDRDGNRLYRDNKVNSAFGELYHANGATNGYDNLQQLTDFRRGTLSDTNSDGVPDTVATAARSQLWGLDAAGNFSSVTTDGTTTSRTHNRQNELTGLGAATLAFDGNGNLTTDQNGKTLVYDPWNRLVAYKNGNTVIDVYTYDPLGRRISENPGTLRDLYYSDDWQVLEERVGGSAQVQYVWSPVYVDALIERDRDADGNSVNGLEERLYAQQDANFNLTALVSASGSVLERYAYDPYGSVTVLDAAWSSRGASSYAWVYGHEGGRYDIVSGRYNFRRRDYDPILSRWLQPDPSRYVDGVNLYQYAQSNPLRLHDPFGMEVFEISSLVSWEAKGWRILAGWENWISIGTTSNIVKVDARNGGEIRYAGYSDRSDSNTYIKIRGDFFKKEFSFDTAAKATKSTQACKCNGKKVDGLYVEVVHLVQAEGQAEITLSGEVEGLGGTIKIHPKKRQARFWFTFLVCPTGGANSPPAVTVKKAEESRAEDSTFQMQAAVFMKPHVLSDDSPGSFPQIVDH